MDKKLTTALGIGLGATLVAGFGIYKYFSRKGKHATQFFGPGGGVAIGNGFTSSFIGNTLAKSQTLYHHNSLYGGGVDVGNSFVGGGLYKKGGSSWGT